MENESFQSRFENAQNSSRPIVTLLTDFGNSDGFVGVMKGVMLQIAPDARLIDIAHDLPPQSVSSASFLNEWSFGYFPVGSVHLCVVDPGVGSKRRAIAVEAAGHFFVAPDNGLLSPILDKPECTRTVSLTNQRYWMDKISHTFHGRDIFAPVAAHLASGVSILELGEEISNPKKNEIPTPCLKDGTIDCAIQYIDHFGNLVTNLDEQTFLRWRDKTGCSNDEIIILIRDQIIEGVSTSYSQSREGELLTIFDGYGCLEIAMNNGNASAMGFNINLPVQICAPWAV